jgi:O-antigen ligase
VFIASFVTAYVLAYFTFVTHNYLQNSFLFDAVATGVLAWLGFTALRMFTHDTFEGRRKQLTILNATHELVTVLVMATIIGLLPA